VPTRRLITRRLVVGAFLACAALAGCGTTRFAFADPNIGKGPEAPVGSYWKYKLPLTPGIRLSGQQVVQAQFGEQRGAFQAIMDIRPDLMTLVITAAEGPRLVTMTWDRTGIKEERTVFAPAAIQGVNVISDIFLSLWTMETVKASMPQGVRAEEVGKVRRFSDEAGKVLVEVETLEKAPNHMVAEVRSKEMGYVLKVTTELDP
jgi:hypothetical protein